MNLKVNGCCCMNLRTAGLFLGWLGIAGSALSIARNIIMLLSAPNANEIHSSTQNSNEGVVLGVVISIAISLFSILISGLLIKGIHENKHRLLLPWLIFNGIGLIIGGVMVCVFAVSSVIVIASQPVLIVFAVILVLFYGLGCWSWTAVYSLKEEIRMAAVRKPLPFNESGPVETTSPYQFIDK